MAKYLVNVVETYRVDTEEEAVTLIEEAKADNHYTLSKYTNQHKELKETKNRDYEEWYQVKLTKIINDEKDPISSIGISYGVSF